MSANVKCIALYPSSIFLVRAQALGRSNVRATLCDRKSVTKLSSHFVICPIQRETMDSREKVLIVFLLFSRTRRHVPCSLLGVSAKGKTTNIRKYVLMQLFT